MLHRHQTEFDAGHAFALPPVEFAHVFNTLCLHPRFDAKRHHEQGRTTALRIQCQHRLKVQMVVMIMRDQHHINGRQLRQRQAGRDAAESIGETAMDGEIQISTAFRPGVRLSLPGSKSRVSLPLEFCVKDNGSGVPEDLLPNLFDPFVTTKQTGSGLGLALVMALTGAAAAQPFGRAPGAPDQGRSRS